MNHWMTKYTVIIEKNPVTGCYVGQCKQIPEAFSQGRTVEELMANMKEAVSLAIECREEDLSAELIIHQGDFHPLPNVQHYFQYTMQCGSFLPYCVLFDHNNVFAMQMEYCFYGQKPWWLF